VQEFINLLKQQAGLAEADAKKLAGDVKDNLGAVTDAATGGVSQLKPLIMKFGFSETIADKAAKFISQHAAELPKLLSGGMLDKAKGLVSGMLGKK
jgi:hypothetical protein